MTFSCSSEELKSKGNELFKQGSFEEALANYHQAIQITPEDHVLYSNAAACCLKLQHFEECVEYCTECLRLCQANNFHFSKPYYRRGTAYLQLKMYKQALADFEKIAQEDALALQGAKECERIIKAQKFAAAIRVERFDLKWPSIRAIPVESTYQGLSLEDSQHINLDFVKQLAQYYQQEQRLHKRILYRILLEAKELFERELNFHPVNFPSNDQSSMITVCGDVHGQFFDLCRIFELNGWPTSSLNDVGTSQHTYVFNGDFVDRGAHSVETITLLFALKCACPNTMYLSRGNHESPTVNRTNSFFTECRTKYPSPKDSVEYVEVWEMFSKVFNTLPIGYVVADSYLVVHGGLPSQIDQFPDLNALNTKIDRFLVPENGSVLSQFLWSDPQTDLQVTTENDFAPSPRGEGVLFSQRATKRFLDRFHLKRLIRSHVWESEGYALHHDNRCITIFSAPNYTGTITPAAFINLLPVNVEKDHLDFVQFTAASFQGKALKPTPSVPLYF